MSVRVVVVDHRPTTRAVLRQLFEAWDWEVVAEASDANEALAATRTSHPDLIVCDPSGGDPDLAQLPELVAPLGAPAVVSIVDFPHEMAATRGRAVLKGVPTDHLRRIFLDALAARGGEQDAAAAPEESEKSEEAAAQATAADLSPGDEPQSDETQAGLEPAGDHAADEAATDEAAADEAATDEAAAEEPPPGPPPRAPIFPSDSVEVRRQAGRALLAEPVTAERAARAAQAVTDPDREVRLLALHALEDNPRLAPTSALEAAAIDPDPGVRARALRLLGRAGHPAHTSLLASHTTADFEEPLRRAAVAGLIDLLARVGSDIDRASLAAALRAFGVVDPGALDEVGPELGRAASTVGLDRLQGFTRDTRAEVALGATRLIAAGASTETSPPGTEPAGPASSAPPVPERPPGEPRPGEPRPAEPRPPAPDAERGPSPTAPSFTAAAASPAGHEEVAAEPGPDPLARVLSDPRAEVRLAAIEALSGTLSPADALTLDSVVRSDTSVPVVLAALRALVAAPAPARLQAAEVALAHREREVRLAGVDLVPADDDGSTVLVRLLADPDFSVVRAAADAMDRFPPAEVLVMVWPLLRTLERRTAELLIDKLVVVDRALTRRLARNASHSPDADDRALGLRVLVALGAGSVGDRLERALGDPARQVRRTVAEAFRDHPELVSVEVIGPRTHDPDVEVRRLTVEVLAAAADDRALTYLLEAARDPVAEVRRPAREHLLARCLTPSARILVAALAQPALRAVATELLGHAPERTAELIAQVAPEADADTRTAMARVLSTPAAVSLLTSALASPDPERRRVALRGLALARETASAPAVITCLEDPEADIRREACVVLGAIGEAGAVPPLRRVLVGDPDMEVVAAAEEALRRLSEVEPVPAPEEPEVDLSDPAGSELPGSGLSSTEA